MTGLELRGVVVELESADPIAARRAYARLMDQPVSGESSTDYVAFDNGSIRWHLGTDSGHHVAFGVDDLTGAERLLGRRGLSDEEQVGVTGDIAARPASHADITGIDHLVFTAPTRDRALALFGATLGLDFRLDRDLGNGVRQLFFRAADLVVEVVTGADTESDGHRNCTLWGIAWRTPDVDEAHRRLTERGMPTSEVRIGKKPGTRLFTIRDRDLATRTVVIGPERLDA